MKYFYFLLLCLFANIYAMENKTVESEDIEMQGEPGSLHSRTTSSTPTSISRVNTNLSESVSPVASFPNLPGSPFRADSEPMASDERAKKLEEQIQEILNKHVDKGNLSAGVSRLIMNTIHIGDKILTDRADAIVHTLLNDAYGIKGFYEYFGIERKNTTSPEGSSLLYVPNSSPQRQPKSFWEKFDSKFTEISNQQKAMASYNKKWWIAAGTVLAFNTAACVTSLALIVDGLYLK